MPGLVGADVDQLRELSRRFTAAADQLRTVVNQTSGRLNAVRWAGADGDRFRSEWQGQSVGRLRAAADALQEAASALLRNADEQDQASAATGGGLGAGFGPGSVGSAWGWPGDVGVAPWFLHPGGGLPDPGMTPLFPHPGGGLTDPGMTPWSPPNGNNGNDGTERPWSFPNPFGQYRGLVGSTPIWPIGGGTAIGMTPLGDAMNVADGTAAVSQWGDVVNEFTKADFSKATVDSNVDFIAAPPGPAFEAARDAVVDYIPQLISNFSINPFGK